MRPTLYAGLAAIVLTACGDPSGTSNDPRGVLRFDYTGALTGSYHGEGASADTAGSASFAFARAQPFGAEIASRSAAETPPVVRVRIALDQRRTGQFTVARLCDLADATPCMAGDVEFPPDAATGARQRYFFTTGTLTVSTASGGRMRGTFSGTAQMHIGREIQVQNGEFDLAVLSR